MARAPLPTWSAYAAAKHALRGFLTSLQIEELEQRSGVRCAMVHPGPIDTPFFAHATSGTARTPGCRRTPTGPRSSRRRSSRSRSARARRSSSAARP